MREWPLAALAVVHGALMGGAESRTDMKGGSTGRAECAPLAHMIMELFDPMRLLWQLVGDMRGTYLNCLQRTESEASVKSKSLEWQARLEDVRRKLDSLGDAALTQEQASDPTPGWAWLAAHSCTLTLERVTRDLECAVTRMDSMVAFSELLPPTPRSTYDWESPSDVALYAQANDATYCWQRASDLCATSIEFALVRLETSQMVCEAMMDAICRIAFPRS